MSRNDFNRLIIFIKEAMDVKIKKTVNSCGQAVGCSVNLAITFPIMVRASYLDFIMVY